MTTAPVSAVVPIKDPNREHFSRTLSSLARQTQPPAEVVIVDSTPGGLRLADADGGCGLCSDPIEAAIQGLQQRGSTVTVVHDESVGRGGGRRRGMDVAGEPVVHHLDEDTVFVHDDAIASGLGRLDDEVVAVGGPVTPIRENLDGQVFAAAERVTPWSLTTHHLMHPQQFCAGADRCVFINQDRGEDLTHRDHLQEHGTIASEPAMLAQKDLPTARQSTLRNVALAAVGGAAAPLAERAITGLIGRVRG